MDALVDRATRAAHHHPAAALSLSQLAGLVRDAGARIPDDVLLQALQADPRRFRIVDPWRGPWSLLRRWAQRASTHSGRTRPHAPIPGLVDGPKVVPRLGAGARRSGPAGRLPQLRRTLVRLGWSVDDSSPMDLARWQRLVLEGRRAGDRLEGC